MPGAPQLSRAVRLAEERVSRPSPVNRQRQDPHSPGRSAGSRDDAEYYDEPRSTRPPLPASRRRGLRLNIKSSFLRPVWMRVAFAVTILFALGALTFGLRQLHAAIVQDERLQIASQDDVEYRDLGHVSRAQLLNVFRGDVGRSLLTVPLATRKSEIEALPWVGHATVMRLLPNRLRVAIVERTPIAFVREGSEIGLVDASGVLLPMSASQTAKYSFPVVTGIVAQDPLSVRAARMQIYGKFLRDLDSGTAQVSKQLSEVDLSDPDDVKAVLSPDGANILVHFGDREYLPRYQRFVQNLPDWKTHYPRLASVDMRYQREVVLDMAPGAPAPATSEDSRATTPAHALAAPLPRPLAASRPQAVPSKRPVIAPTAKPLHPAPAAAIKLKPAVPAVPVVHLQQSFDVHPKAATQ